MLLACGAAGYGGAAPAYTVNLTPAAPKTLFLAVGVGSFSVGIYNSGGKPANNATVNVVSVSVPAAAVGSGAVQTMTTNSTQSNSFLDNYPFCNAPGELYVGAFYRTTGQGNGGPSGATLIATVPATLLNAAGDPIPFSQISWTSRGNGDLGAEPFPAGSFTAGGSQTLGSVSRDQWAESCWSFSYGNTVVPAAGTFTGRVTYTISAP
ncbi:MAG: hypothetical protein JSR67_07035 [Proteobacteria bacterium]|nr:hypothetical protein [Pseudomonadota bacterium]